VCLTSEVDSGSADAMFSHLRKSLSPSLDEGLVICDEFEYKDPVDGSVTSKQGIRFIFHDGCRIIFRLSGTGSSGATIRVYVERIVNDAGLLVEDTAVAAHQPASRPQDMIQDLIAKALRWSQLEEFTGRKGPTVIT
jgi:phosphoglucomutase